MEIIFHSPFSYDFFRMVSFPPMRHLERGYLPIWVKKLKLNGNAEPRDLLTPCSLYHWASNFAALQRFRRNNSGEEWYLGHSIISLQLLFAWDEGKLSFCIGNTI